eukprot:CAMPEP_0183720806 /NCGR_PEP_ID=MMETSP0737-20130205/13323_1 /TAXON_ID=385413 /ORGANISM="Thalassiosira miniscula, Strain CCMP1093" /LENGTH=167 /DNA_ID=CAMNT_0025950741 /DNA_START=91 /DNA_END=591 /DNA_ORIENTATION=-
MGMAIMLNLVENLHMENAAVMDKKPISLIVDFAHRRNSYVKPTKRTVQFSTKIEVRFYERPEVDASKLYWSPVEYNAMREARRQAVAEARRLHETISTKPGRIAIRDADFDDLTGIENCLTQKLMENRRRCKEDTTCAVLEEQKRQQFLGSYNPEKLAFIARVSSVW